MPTRWIHALPPAASRMPGSRPGPHVQCPDRQKSVLLICKSAPVRTTLNFDDDLYRELKVAAAEQGVSATSLIEAAVRDALRARVASQRPEFPVSRRSGGVRSGTDLSDPDQIYDLLYGIEDVEAARSTPR